MHMLERETDACGVYARFLPVTWIGWLAARKCELCSGMSSLYSGRARRTEYRMYYSRSLLSTALSKHIIERDARLGL